MTSEGKIRRIASNMVSLNGRSLGRYAVEICGKYVTAYYPLDEELPFTVWMQEPIRMFEKDGKIQIQEQQV